MALNDFPQQSEGSAWRTHLKVASEHFLVLMPRKWICELSARYATPWAAPCLVQSLSFLFPESLPLNL